MEGENVNNMKMLSEKKGEEEEEKEMVRVLVVDDSLMDRKIVERLIKKNGQNFEVVTVDSGKKALEVLGLNEGKVLSIVNEQKIDIVLTDYCMPEMTGYDLLSALKEHSCFRSIPVVIMSSENDAQRIARCLASGAEEFVLKPLQPKHVENLKLYGKRKETVSTQSTKSETKRKLPLELQLAENGGAERRVCLAGVAVA